MNAIQHIDDALDMANKLPHVTAPPEAAFLDINDIDHRMFVNLNKVGTHRSNHITGKIQWKLFVRYIVNLSHYDN